MSKMPTCECGGAITLSREDYVYDESGLSNVTLVDIEVRRCKSCGETGPVIQNIDGLHRAMARYIVQKPARLNGEEIRFLRTYLDLMSKDFAKVFGVDKTHVSRWENNRAAMGGGADRALRLLVMHQRSVGSFLPTELNEILESIQDVKKSTRVRLERRTGGWLETEAA